jgi:hypothetical protein
LVGTPKTCHKIDINRTAQDFLDHWFQMCFDEYRTEFARQLITPEGKAFTKDEVIAKLRNCHDSYTAFRNIAFAAPSTSFQWDDENKKGLGHAEGRIRYDAETESGETVHIEGPFKLYMLNEEGYWDIFYFVLSGFAW